jgi:hypothetical protein
VCRLDWPQDAAWFKYTTCAGDNCGADAKLGDKNPLLFPAYTLSGYASLLALLVQKYKNPLLFPAYSLSGYASLLALLVQKYKNPLLFPAYSLSGYAGVLNGAASLLALLVPKCHY